MKDIKELIKLSKYLGSRYDLVQLSGGNISVKSDESNLLIKASGIHLSEMSKNNGIVKVNNFNVLNIINEFIIKKLNNKKKLNSQSVSKLNKIIIGEKIKPSIETFMHSLLGKFVAHIHPIILNPILYSDDHESFFQNFKEYIVIDYKTPGIELAIEIFKHLDKYIETHFDIPKIIFLKNHGIIVTERNIDKIINIIENIILKASEYFNINMKRYELCSEISKHLDLSKIVVLSEDILINKILKENRELFFKKPFCPDTMVFCGDNIIEIESITDIKKYNKKPIEIIIYKENVFFIAENGKKAKNIEEIFKAHLMSLNIYSKNVNYLNEKELKYLKNWKSEKYRKEI